jgi:hypothetical protein
MRKLSEKFNRLRARTKFGITFLVVFIIELPVIPYALHHNPDLLPAWPKWEFVAVCALIIAASAAFLAGCGLVCELLFKRIVRPNLHVMNDPTALKVVISIFVVAFLTSLGFLVHARSQDFWWREEVYGLAGYMGSERALHDFRDGKLRLFVIAGERDDDQFSGTNDGPFQVWFPQYYPAVYQMRYATEQEVEFYNGKMRYMHEHPEKFLTNTTNRQSGFKFEVRQKS